MRKEILSLCLLTAGVASGADFKEGYISYSLNSPTTVSVTEVAIGYTEEYGGYTLRDTTRFEVPETVKFMGRQLTVTAIGRAAFTNSRIDTLVLPRTITAIDDYAFQNCGLKCINLPDGIETLGDGCFYNCQLLTITLPKSLKTIGTQAFFSCPLREIRFPKGLTTIGREAFRNCHSLTELDLPESLKTIGNSAFASCTSLQTISTHGDLESIGSDSFNRCKNLRTVIFGGKVEALGGFGFCTSLQTFTVPEGTQRVYSRTFIGCTALKEVVLSKGIREIGQSAFASCSSLKEIVLPAALKAIDMGTFQDCTGLETITIGENVESISNESLEGCKNLKCLIVRSRKPCNYGASSFSQTIVDLFNQVELRIPTGSKETYAAAAFWKNFRNMTEYEPQDACQVFVLTVKEGGTVTCNGETFGEGESSVVVPAEKPFELLFQPDDDHQVSYVEHRYNYGIDYMKDQVKDNRLTIPELKQNSNLWVFFKAAKVNLDILQNEMGLVRLSVSKNKSYGCRIIGEEGWQVNSITFNGEDITKKGGEGNYILTPVIKDDAVIRIALEKSQTGISLPLQEGVRILGDAEGITIRNARIGERISIYSLEGQLLKTITGTGNDIHQSLRPGAVYVVQTESKSIKIRL